MSRTRAEEDHSELGKYFGEQVSTIGWSLSEVAERTGTSPSYASKVFNGKIKEPGATFTVYMARALGLTTEDLYPHCLPRWMEEVTRKIEQVSMQLPSNIAQAFKETLPRNTIEAGFYTRLLNNLQKPSKIPGTKPIDSEA